MRLPPWERYYRNGNADRYLEGDRISVALSENLGPPSSAHCVQHFIHLARALVSLQKIFFRHASLSMRSAFHTKNVGISTRREASLGKIQPRRHALAYVDSYGRRHDPTVKCNFSWLEEPAHSYIWHSNASTRVQDLELPPLDARQQWFK